jgi:hypothetical protein
MATTTQRRDTLRQPEPLQATPKGRIGLIVAANRFQQVGALP